MSVTVTLGYVNHNMGTYITIIILYYILLSYNYHNYHMRWYKIHKKYIKPYTHCKLC